MSLRAMVHVGSSVTSGALVDGKQIIFAAAREYRFQEELDQKVFVDTVTESLKGVLADLLAAKKGSPVACEIFLSSPFAAGKLNLLRRASEKPFRVTEALVSELQNADLELLKTDKRHAVVDNQIMRYRVNGYPVATPFGQTASSIELAHYVSVGDGALLKSWRELVKSALHHNQLSFHSASLAVTKAILGSPLQLYTSFVLLEVGGEVTEISFIKHNFLRESFSFPLGSHSLLRDRVKTGKLAPAVAKSQLEQGHSSTDAAEAAWQEQLLVGLKQVIQHGFWGGEIVILVEDPSLAGRFANLLSSEFLAQLSFGTKPPPAVMLDAQHFSNQIESAAGVAPSLALIASAASVII